MSETLARIDPIELEREGKPVGRKPVISESKAVEEGLEVYLDRNRVLGTVYFEPYFPEKSMVTDAYSKFNRSPDPRQRAYEWFLITLIKERGFIADGNFEEQHEIKPPYESELLYAPEAVAIDIEDLND